MVQLSIVFPILSLVISTLNLLLNFVKTPKEKQKEFLNLLVKIYIWIVRICTYSYLLYALIFFFNNPITHRTIFLLIAGICSLFILLLAETMDRYKKISVEITEMIEKLTEIVKSTSNNDERVLGIIEKITDRLKNKKIK